MDIDTIYTKTAKGVTQVNQKSQSLSRDLMKVLKAIDGKSTAKELAEKIDFDIPALEKALTALTKDNFIKIFEVKKLVPLSDFGGDPDDFDFTTPDKTVRFEPSPYRSPASLDQVERAAPKPAEPTPANNDAELQSALQAVRAKAQAEARARAEREAQARARLEVEVRAQKDAELRAREEALRAEQAAMEARAALEAKLNEEKRQRDLLSDTRSRMSREQLDRESEQQRQLAAARAEAEAEAKALAVARAKAEAEAKALAEMRAQAEAAAIRQKEELEAAQRALRAQLKAEIEAKVRAEMEALLNSDIEENARAEVEAAVREEAQEEARRLLEEQLAAERATLAEAEAIATRRAEEVAKRMLAEQETKMRAEMEARLAELAAEKARVEADARKMAETQAEEAAQAAAELAIRLKAEEGAHRADKEAAQQREEQHKRERARLEARAREEAAGRAQIEAELAAQLQAEKEAKFQAEARALIEQEMRFKTEREQKTQIEAERRAREEAEQKAFMETKARETASRVALEQAAKREQIERQAEEALMQERALREKAEEKARMDEEEEERQRLAQVARLKELSEQAERIKEAPPADKGRKAQLAAKKSRNPIAWIAISVVVLLISAVVAVQVVPLNAVNERLEKSLTAWIHDDVSSTNLHINLFPTPHVKLDQLALGKLLDAKAASGSLFMDFGSLFSDRFSVSTMQLNDVTIAANALPRALSWANAENRGKAIEISNIALRNVKVDIKGVTLDAFDADLKLDRNGSIIRASARTRDGKWNLDTYPDKTSQNGAWVVDFTARNLALPLGKPLPIAELKATGSWLGEQIDFTTVEAKLFEGSGSGSLRLNWQQGINLSSQFALQKIRLDDLMGAFTRDISLNGKLEGSFDATSSATSVGALLDKLVLQGTFTVKDGAIGSVDLVQAMRSPDSLGRGGQTKFTELNGQLSVSDESVRYEKLRLTGGVLLANGYVATINKEGAVAGSINAEIRSNVTQDKAAFSIGGTMTRPVLKRGG